MAAIDDNGDPGCRLLLGADPLRHWAVDSEESEPLAGPDPLAIDDQEEFPA
ncbi:hypothetical protein [Streptosporangium sp. NBC_01756]|uniref:hypothetical protein n=1 Tax=Streptosporangium sp. NBC_01756 TaxID=2975950 RepID=UPI002DD80D8D|nr:hypothetical protein [Streptosporangium sp. NBC_01756]WSC86214.1 hypothetical protein OIE48_38640 [Streptosporangium sp. NBC_01756]